jgi:hypothetical protein
MDWSLGLWAFDSVLLRRLTRYPMAALLMKLRNVPADELDAICALLDEHALAYYETTAGSFGISLPALWLQDETQLDHARTLLDIFAQQRLQQAQTEFNALKLAGRSRTFLDIARENPVRFVAYIIVIIVLIYISIVPLLHLTEIR